VPSARQLLPAENEFIVIPHLPFYNFSMPAGTETRAPSADVRTRVQDVINLIRPAVQADGGDIELVDVSPDGVVHIRFHGACHGCPSSTMTLHMGIERNLRERVPEVTQVVPVA
jgi:Fe-S cluster biogenesis protein NfuA